MIIWKFGNLEMNGRYEIVNPVQNEPVGMAMSKIRKI
jgi:hypothetical protein